METLIEAIRVALLPDASDEAKHQGALACRTILTALEAKEGEPLAVPADMPTAGAGSSYSPSACATRMAPGNVALDHSSAISAHKPAHNEAPPDRGTAPLAIEPQQVAAIVGALRNLPPEQLLDLAIARLRAALPGNAAAPSVAPVRFQLIPIAPLATTVGPKGGGS